MYITANRPVLLQTALFARDSSRVFWISSRVDKTELFRVQHFSPTNTECDIGGISLKSQARAPLTAVQP